MTIKVKEMNEKPVLAILAMDDPVRHFRGNRNNFIDIIKAGQEKNITIYVVSYKELKLNNKRWLGHVYDLEKKTWHSASMPLPHVIYNRIPFREDEVDPEVQAAIQACLKHPRIKLFNPSYFNKWTLIEWLSRSKKTKQYVPMTKRLSSQYSLRKLLRRHPVVYLKPESGKAGSGIMRVKKVHVKGVRTPSFQLSMQEGKQNENVYFRQFSPLWTRTKHTMEENKYIAQQGIQLCSFQKRPYDLRVLVQKNYKGLWSITGVGARVAGKANITTHVPRGGSIEDPVKLLEENFGKKAAMHVMKRVHQSGLRIAEQIEKREKQLLGEMSIDLGVDVNRAIWFFEANAKPMKFDEPHIRVKSLDRIIQYSMFLSKQKNKKK